ncbi:MAG: hypothetical protein QOK27_1766 [Gemmatimonadales bacterium]|jgi:hypothetical protein|nr:hypothetical protein [Gemmatimonadales bacterium]
MRELPLTDWVGWLATAVFVLSYRFRDQRTLRWIQAFAAVLWVGYGLARHAMPVVVANLLVAGMALYSSLRPDLSRVNGAGRSHTS